MPEDKKKVPIQIKISDTEILTEKGVRDKLIWNRSQRIKFEKLYNESHKENMQLRDELFKVQTDLGRNETILSARVQVKKGERLPVSTVIERLQWNREEKKKLSEQCEKLKNDLKQKEENCRKNHFDRSTKFAVNEKDAYTVDQLIEKLLWYRKKDEEYKAIKEENSQLKFELDNTKNSKTYKISRAITWLPRKIRGNKKS